MQLLVTRQRKLIRHSPVTQLRPFVAEIARIGEFIETVEDGAESRRTFAESVNLAVNQTLVRSINTSVVAILPVGSILFIGALILGAGTLRDISLALFIGIIVGTYSTIFIAAPLYAQLRSGEDAVKKRDKRTRAVREASLVVAAK